VNDTPDPTEFVVSVISHIGLSPKQRFSLGVSLIAQVTEEMKPDPHPGNPFRDVFMDRNYPFETAAAGLAGFLQNMKDIGVSTKAGEGLVVRVEAEPAPEARDEGAAEAVAKADPAPPVATPVPADLQDAAGRQVEP